MKEQAAVLPSMRLDGKVALVTGAGRGIGRGCALALAEVGAEVIAMSRTRSEIEAVAEEIRQTGGNARALACDVADSAQVRSLIGGLDRLDVLVNNAGISVRCPFLETEEGLLDSVLRVNVRAAFIVAQEAARIMDRQGGGAIINISSQSGVVGRAGNSVYAGSKHFMEGVTKSIAVELASKQIRVNTVCPTIIETPMTRPLLTDPAFKESVLAQMPMRRFGQVEEVVGAVVFLASPAASLITGASLMVDGGWTAQ